MHAYLEYLNIACHGQHDFMNEIDILSYHVFEMTSRRIQQKTGFDFERMMKAPKIGEVVVKCYK